MGSLTYLDAHRPSLRRSEDWAGTPRSPTMCAYSPSFVNLGEFHSIACSLTLASVERSGTCSEFPRSVIAELERWARENVRGLSYVHISPTTGHTRIETKDDWATFRYEVHLNPAWLTKGFGALP